LGIFSTICERTFDAQPNAIYSICKNSLDLRGKSSLKKALNVKYAREDTIKFIPANLMTRDLFQSKLIRYKELQQLNTLLKKQSKSGDSNFWTSLTIQAKQGLFKDMGAFEEAVAVRAERKAAGKALNGMRFDSYFNSFLTTMAAMSPAAAKYLRDNFAGRSLRNMRHQRKINVGHIEDGIVMANFKQVAGYIKDLGYTGPLALASDQTVCVKSLRSHNGYIVGAQGGDVPFSDLEELSNLVKDITLNDKICSKVCGFLCFLKH
jgi:hypothetical protein